MKTPIRNCTDLPRKGELYGDCVLDNRAEPVIRQGGGEPFMSCYDIEEGVHRIHIVDPSQSFSPAIVQSVRENLSASIAETMSDWKLVPTVPVCETQTTGEGSSK